MAIIDDILDFSKIEAGKLSLQEVDFAPRQVIGAASELFAAKVQAKGVTMTISVAPDVPAWLRGDPGACVKSWSI